MKKIYLIIVFTIVGLASLYAMFGYKLTNNQIQEKKVEALKATKVAKPVNKTNLELAVEEDEQLILGDWFLEEDGKSKLTFKTDGICDQYYDGELTSSYQYSISKTSPQCGYEVSSNPNLSYLQWTDTQELNDKWCFNIYSLTDSVLNIGLLGTGDIGIYTRQGYSGTGTIDVAVYYNTAQSRTFQGRKTCPPRWRAVGGLYTYTVQANTYTSEISQADADQKALNDILQNGQRIADGKVICQP